jgi:hypothetical protein
MERRSGLRWRKNNFPFHHEFAGHPRECEAFIPLPAPVMTANRFNRKSSHSKDRRDVSTALELANAFTRC